MVSSALTWQATALHELITIRVPLTTTTGWIPFSHTIFLVIVPFTVPSTVLYSSAPAGAAEVMLTPHTSLILSIILTVTRVNAVGCGESWNISTHNTARRKGTGKGEDLKFWKRGSDWKYEIPIFWQFWSMFSPYSAGIDFRRQNLTSVDVRFWHLKSIPVLWE